MSRSSRTRSRLALEISRARGPFLWVIVAVVFGIIATVAIVNNLTGVSIFGGDFTAQIRVDDAKGITPGTQEVEMAGVDVGTVSGEKLIDDQPVLTLSIHNQYAPLYRNARFQIRPNTPLEDLYVDIVNRGTPSAGVLTSNDVVNEDQTQTPVDISQVLDMFQPDVRGELTVLLENLAKGSPDNGTHLYAAFEQLAPFLSVADQTLHVVAVRKRLVAQAMTSFTNVAYALGERDRQLTGLVRSGNQSVAKLADEDGPFSATLADLPGTMGDLRTSFATLRNTETTLDPALSKLEPVARNLSGALTSLKQLATAANPALDAFQPALTKLRPLAVQLRPTAGDLSSAVSALRPQAPEFNDITKLVVPCEPALTGFFNNTISVFKYYDGFGAWPRGNLTFDDSTVSGTGTDNLTQYTPCTGPVK